MSFMLVSALSTKPEAFPSGLAFLFLGMLSSATAAAVRAVEKRLDALEQASATGKAKPAINPAQPNDTSE